MLANTLTQSPECKPLSTGTSAFTPCRPPRWRSPYWPHPHAHSPGQEVLPRRAGGQFSDGGPPSPEGPPTPLGLQEALTHSLRPAPGPGRPALYLQLTPPPPPALPLLFPFSAPTPPAPPQSPCSLTPGPSIQAPFAVPFLLPLPTPVLLHFLGSLPSSTSLGGARYPGRDSRTSAVAQCLRQALRGPTPRPRSARERPGARLSPQHAHPGTAAPTSPNTQQCAKPPRARSGRTVGHLLSAVRTPLFCDPPPAPKRPLRFLKGGPHPTRKRLLAGRGARPTGPCRESPARERGRHQARSGALTPRPERGAL